MKKLLFFDIDGTLLLTGGCGKIAFEKAFDEVFSVQNAWGETVPDGKTDPIIFQEIAKRVLGRTLNESEYLSLENRYLESFREEIWRSPRFRLMPGVSELIEHLSEDPELVLAIVTGNIEEAAKLKLKRAGFDGMFQFGAYGSDSHDRARIVEIALKRAEDFLKCPTTPQNTFVIGDTLHDITAAKAHRLKTIAVCTGRYKRADFLPHNPDHILRDFTDIIRFSASLKGTAACG